MITYQFKERAHLLRRMRKYSRRSIATTVCLAMILWLSPNVAPATTAIIGPTPVCPATTNIYSVSTDLVGATFQWLVGTNNSASASILGSATNSSLEIVALTDGTFDLECLVDDGITNETASTSVTVPELLNATPLTSQVACPGEMVTFSTVVSGGGGYTVAWRKDGDIIPDASSLSLTLSNITSASTGLYVVEITGNCNSLTNTATLDIHPSADLTCPTNLNLQCVSEIPAPDTNSIVSSNAVAIVHLGDETVTNGCELIVTRTYAALNTCGATNTCAQIITVMDTVPPVLTGITNLTSEFGEPWAFVTPDADDNCLGTNVTLAISSTVTNSLCGNTYEAIQTWTATDSCSNSAAFSQTVTVQDTTPPAFTGLTNQVIEFGDAWDFITPEVTDIADGTNVAIVISSTITNSLCGNTYEAIQTWTATDSCSNSAAFSQTVTVQDTMPPAFTGLTNQIIEFGTTWAFITPEATDIADGTNVTLVISSTVTNPLCGNTYEAIQTWTATDSCSNSAAFSQTVTVQDTTPPAFTGLTNQVIECGTVWDFITPEVTDIADGTNVLLMVTETTTNGLCGTTFETTRTWTTTDSCSNAAAFSQTVLIQDTTPPIIICATNRIVECGEAWDFDAPTATDVCGNTNVSIAILDTTVVPLVGETFSSTRTWVAEDACGNTNTCSQTITIVDTTPPQIFCPSNIVVECVGGAGNIVNYDPTAIDGCDTNVPVVCTPPSGSAFSLGTNTVLCVATDDSGNTNQCSFLVIVEDTTPPVITCPPNLIVSEAPRDLGSAVVTFSEPTVVEACDAMPQLTAEPPSGFNFPVGTNTVTWTAVDSSGNSNTCTFTIRVIPYRLFVVSNTGDAGPGSLRQAILDGNDAPDENLIIFTLPGSGPFGIDLETALPPITSPTILDGWSQSGSNTAPIIEVRGASNSFDGLVIQSGPSVVQGLSLSGFDTAIRIEGVSSNVIQGNYLGVDVTGASAPGNGSHGIYLDSTANSIGGTTPGTGNLISGNGSHGIVLSSAAASNNIVEGNVIGAAFDVATPLPNLGHGVFLTNQASANRIGGTGSNAGNIIVFNGAAGVALDSSAGAGNAILGNSTWDNAALGIDLGADGVTPNDENDSDTGANLLQNYPILSDARSFSGMTIIEGELSTKPNTTYRVEFFLDDVADPSTNGEGRTYIGSTLVNVKGNGTENFSATFPLTAVYTQFISATATDPEGNTSEFSPVVQVRTPPIIEQQPQSTNSSTGESVTFCAQVSGTPPIEFQWRLNGVNIPGATNVCYTIPSTELADGGTYTVVVKNDLAAFASTTASLILGGSNILSLATGDNFVEAVDISTFGGGTNGTLVGNNALATLEPFEPKHAGKDGGRSVWYRWRTPDGTKGITTLRTEGSTYDTLVAVYQVSSLTNVNEAGFLTNLVLVADGEDDARNYASEVRFNAFFKSPSNSWYYIAVDAFDGVGGDFVLTWNHEKTSHMLPVILQQPASQTVLPGASVTFTNISVPECAVGHLDCNHNHWEANNNQKEKLTYQWYFNGTVILNATNRSLTIPSVQPEHVGAYRVRVFTPWQYLDSKVADLQINNTGGNVQFVQATDKFGDLQFVGAIFVGVPPNEVAGPASSGIAAAAAAGTVARGYSGSQIFNTAGSATGPGEVNCGVIGGSSEWLTLIAEQTGTLFLNTDGSSYDTVMSVFQRNPTNAAALILAGCNNNGGLDGLDSAVTMPVNIGTTNYILVDGVNGVTGILQFNYSLATTTILKVAGRTSAGANIIQVNGRPGLNFSVQTTTNLKNWSTVVTTNAPTGILDYTDMSSIGQPVRYYRALILP